MNNEAIAKLGTDLALGRFTAQDIATKFENNDPQEILRKALKELSAFNDHTGKIDYKQFRRNEVEIFEILEVIIQETVNTGLEDGFGGEFVEYRNLAWGDTNIFSAPSNELYRISNISDGNGNIRRQQLREGSSFAVEVETYGVKIMEDYTRFLAGRADWGKQMQTIGLSFKEQLNNQIFKTLLGTYGEHSATYHKTGALDEDKIVEMAMHIEARTGDKVGIYGTKLALRTLTPDSVSDAMADTRNNLGYYGSIAGMALHEIKQAHAHNAMPRGAEDTFLIPNDVLLLLPESKDKLIKVVNEGTAVIQSTTGGVTADMVQEHFVSQKFGISVISSKAFGFVKLS